MSDSDKKKEAKIIRLPSRRLTDAERIQILLDLEEGKTWRRIVEDRKVSTSTIASVRNEYLQNTELIEKIRSLRLPKLYHISERFLDELDARDLDGTSIKDIGILAGIIIDKIQKEEGKTGSINIAIANMESLGLLK